MAFLAVRGSPIHTAATIAREHYGGRVQDGGEGGRKVYLGGGDQGERQGRVQEPRTRNDLHRPRIFGMLPTARA